ncbi:MAG: replicative DNA helicase [Candidatus Delongbacteria bacterium]|nr:replicative DNA helicase [Candidatus Delongbacteria bacterium]
MSDTDRLQPPHSNEAEQQVIGSMLIDQDACALVLENLQAEHFYQLEHKVMFKAMQRLFEEGRPIDIVTLHAELEKMESLEQAGGGSYLSDCLAVTTSTANVQYHLEIVHQHALLRELIRIGNRLQREGNSPAAVFDELLRDVEDQLYRLSTGQSLQRDFIPTAEGMKDVMKEIESIQQKGGGLQGITTGFPDLDRMLGGFSPGSLVVLAGRPGMGKTAFALNLARNAAAHNYKIAFISLEMTWKELGMRLIMIESGVSLTPLKSGSILRDTQTRKLARAAANLASYQVFIDDTSKVSLTDLRAKLQRLSMTGDKVDMLFIDYLQLMHLPDADNQALRVAAATRALKAMAKDFEIPVVALSQLSRESERRKESKRPILSDLRDSGAIEQDADIVMFVHRDEVYRKTDDSGKSLENQALIDVGKNRTGPIGPVKLTFHKHIQRFEEFIAEDNAPPPAPGQERAAEEIGF